jgi:hypothetical protein
MIWALVNPSSSQTRAKEGPCVEFNVPNLYCLRECLLNAIKLNVTYPHAVTSPFKQFKYSYKLLHRRNESATEQQQASRPVPWTEATLFLCSICCHVTEWLQTEFGLVIGFMEHLHFDTGCDYTLQFTITHILVSTVTSSLTLLGSGFQRRTFPFLLVPELPPASVTSF